MRVFLLEQDLIALRAQMSTCEDRARQERRIDAVRSLLKKERAALRS